ncbi:type II secretion system protein N [Massilia arenosa]|uniref:Type II secretion system protein N n=1 Tax=Zemynaea arenosa TaxID=2561931 RepID=A0A4Y9SJ32_9BURK|nr:type II secretion system protein N [Massilia arenosa]TFW22154.1 type II secretion system protein N [Massilia arenosa]
MKRAALWIVALAVVVALTLFAFLPASWLGPIVEKQTGGRLTLGDPQGTLWHGSAFVGGAAGPDGAVTPLLPGRFSWTLSPMVLVGRVNMELDNPDALMLPVTVTGSWSQWQVSPGTLKLPADALAGLGAPLNTIAPSGQMRLTWTALQLERAVNTVAVSGHTTLDMQDMSSRMSPIKPLGSYQMAMDWHGRDAQMVLSTLKGALVLSGNGALTNGRFSFSGQATAGAGYENTMGNLLNLLGQHQVVNGKNIIALEFK